MDFDPAPLIARLRAPVLLVYGADDEWTPVDASVAAFARAAPEVVRLPGTGHEPSPRDPRYDAALLGWLSCALADLA
jgi:pimeloyl-ACP methyl ester carboxylesterase